MLQVADSYDGSRGAEGLKPACPDRREGALGGGAEVRFVRTQVGEGGGCQITFFVAPIVSEHQCGLAL
jgi:hypothetical protein